MESQFWDVLSAQPFLVLVVVFGGIIAIAVIINAVTKIHDTLGFKTRYELDREDYLAKEQRRDEQFGEMWNEIKDMRAENKEEFKALKDDISSVKDANIMVLGDRISQRSSYYIKMGSIPASEMVEYQLMYETYKAIGGNHGIDNIFQKTVATLPLTANEEES